MKKMGFLLIMVSALPALGEMSMTKVQIQNCTADGTACISIKSERAEVSALRPIYFLKSVDVEIHRIKGTRESFKKSAGYLDLDNNQLILQTVDKKGTLREDVFNLTTLQKQTFVTR
jgi:hypothetical protein